MVDYTQPLKATFELQRKSFEQSQRAIGQTVGLQQRFGRVAVDGLEAQESLQRNAVELQQDFVLNVLDAVAPNVPDAKEAVVESRDMVDKQYETLLEIHEELFDMVTGEVNESVVTVDELVEGYFTVLEEQLDVLHEAHEELEDQSVKAVDELQEQFEEVQAQDDEFRGQDGRFQAQDEEDSDQSVGTVET